MTEAGNESGSGLLWKQAIFILMCDLGEPPVILTEVGIQSPFSHPT